MAINQLLHHDQARNRGEVSYTGRWLIGAAGAVSTKTGGQGMTLTRTAEGLYTLTLEATPAAVLHIAAKAAGNTSVISQLTFTTTGGTFRNGAYASPQTPLEVTEGESLSFHAIVLKSLVK